MDIADWISVDEVFAAQMAYRDALLRGCRDHVYQCAPEADAASLELRDIIIDECGFTREAETVRRPDGVCVDIAVESPLVAAARLVQMDLCVLQASDIDKPHILTAGVLCFPSSWSLGQKMGRDLASIHAPVPEYTGRIEIMVQRMFRAIRPEQPLWRANPLIYTDPDLHQPREEGVSKPMEVGAPRFVRVERQTFRCLPRTGAVVFGIQNSVVKADDLSRESLTALAKMRPELLGVPYKNEA
ncbi:MAG: heme-dependent oxidative N-demethylase family protein [Maricaulaceae bacterium]